MHDSLCEFLGVNTIFFHFVTHSIDPKEDIERYEWKHFKGWGGSVEIRNLCTDFISKRNEIQRIRKFVLSSSENISYDQWVEERTCSKGNRWYTYTRNKAKCSS